MTKLLYPPRGVTHFRVPAKPPDLPHGHEHHSLLWGCGELHEYDGVHGIDCPQDVAYYESLPLEQRCIDPALRAPILVNGDDPAEVMTQRELLERRRHAASFRIEDSEDEESAAGLEATSADPEEIERLRARVAELEGAATSQPVANEPDDAAKQPISSAFLAGQAMARAGAPRQNPFDGRKLEGKDWAAGYDSMAGKQQGAGAGA